LEFCPCRIILEVFGMAWVDVGGGLPAPTKLRSEEALRELKERVLRGTTTIGLRCADGVVLATDRRVTAGYYIAHKRGKKIYAIDDHVAATVAGAVADAQKLVDTLRVEAKLYRYDADRPIPVKALATLASNVLFSARPHIYVVRVLLGGVDSEEGPALYSVDWFGTVTGELYTATGSGYPVAIGILEEGYREGITTEEAVPLAVRAVRSAIMRDTGSGEGIDVAVVTSRGVRLLTDDEVRRYLRRA